MTPEHLNRTIVDRCCDALKILMRTSCAEIIKEAITQAKKEAYEEGYKKGLVEAKCQSCDNQMTYKDMQAAIKNLSELPDCMKGSAPNTAVAAIKALSGGKND